MGAELLLERAAKRRAAPHPGTSTSLPYTRRCSCGGSWRCLCMCSPLAQRGHSISTRSTWRNSCAPSGRFAPSAATCLPLAAARRTGSAARRRGAAARAAESAAPSCLRARRRRRAPRPTAPRRRSRWPLALRRLDTTPWHGLIGVTQSSSSPTELDPAAEIPMPTPEPSVAARTCTGGSSSTYGMPLAATRAGWPSFCSASAASAPSPSAVAQIARFQSTARRRPSRRARVWLAASASGTRRRPCARGPG